MSKDLAYYRLLPYEREWLMRDDGTQKHFVVRLKDLPAIAGDGASSDEAVEDLRVAFDEFVAAWLEAGRPIPEPSRAFTVPAAPEQRPAKEWPAVLLSPERSDEETASSWAERAVVYINTVLVEDSKQEPRLETLAEGAVLV
jgi:predicted RNase H-like HicB family nuclease